VELRHIEIGDLALYEAIHCDPAMMAELGGPLPREGLAEKLQRDAASTEAGEVWVLKIIPDEDAGIAAGTVTVWEHAWRGQRINEIGWMVLPAFQGQGIGSEAVRSVIQRARSEKRWDVVHAFPPLTNPRSNAMCRKMGFTMIEVGEYQFRDRILRCNHWQLDLREGGFAGSRSRSEGGGPGRTPSE
jgi:RimJ/RimL family protein N-acetyltransferase